MYTYAEEKPKLFTEEGQVAFLRVRDAAQKILATAGAFRWWELRSAVGSIDDWFFSCCLDRLIELNELVRLERPNIASQYQVYTKKGV